MRFHFKRELKRELCNEGFKKPSLKNDVKFGKRRLLGCLALFDSLFQRYFFLAISAGFIIFIVNVI